MGHSKLKTEVPSGWELVPAGEVFKYLRTHSFSRENLTSKIIDGSEVGNIHYGDLHSTHVKPTLDVIKSAIPTVNDSNFNPDPGDLLKDGDIVMADASEDYKGIGVAVLLKGVGNKRIVGGLHTFVLRDFSDKTTAGYRQFVFRNPVIRRRLQKIANGVSVYGISKTEVSKLLLPLPSVSEQHRIVAVLETWDLAIEKLEWMIELKKKVIKGLMQELLTGKRRLPGFTDSWSQTKLINIGTFSKGAGILKDEVTRIGHNAVRYGELYTKYDFEIREIFSHIPDSVVPTTRKIKFGDLLFAGSGETIDEIGKSAVYLLKQDGYAGGDTIIFTPHNSDGLFLAYFLNTGIARKKLRELGQGQSVVHLYKKDLEKLSFKLPKQTEQEAISKLLTLARFEIIQLQKMLNGWSLQKKYLLNSLITGTIRTPETLSTPK